jgi:hypothetical protein
MAIDTTDIGMGPALFFLSPFDKLVIVPDEVNIQEELHHRVIPPTEPRLVADFCSLLQTLVGV